MTKHRFATEEIEKFSTVDLIAELKRRYQVLSRPERSCVIIGHPQAGVSSQATFLRKEWGMCLIKRSDVLAKDDSDIHEGLNKLSDELASFRCRRGFVMENFPATEQEAKLFDSMMNKAHADRKEYTPVLLTMPSETEEDQKSSLDLVTKRAMGHMVHEKSGRIYNSSVTDLSPQIPNTDDVTGEPLICPRKDMTGLADKALLWWNTSKPEIMNYYGSRLRVVDASQTRDSVSVEISKALLQAGSQ